MRYRHVVLALLFLLSIITYVDRVCIAVAGPRMQQDLGITPDLWNPLDKVESDDNPFVERVPVRKNGHHQSDRDGATRACEPDFCLPAPDPGEG